MREIQGLKKNRDLSELSSSDDDSFEIPQKENQSENKKEQTPSPVRFEDTSPKFKHIDSDDLNEVAAQIMTLFPDEKLRVKKQAQVKQVLDSLRSKYIR